MILIRRTCSLDVAAAILMSLQLIITHKRKQINHFPCMALGGGIGVRGGSRDVTWEREHVSQQVLFTKTALCQGFSWGTLVLIKTGPILNSNPLARLACSGHTLSNHWNRWMFLHYHGWTVSINRVQPPSRARVRLEFTAHRSTNNAAVCYEGPC